MYNDFIIDVLRGNVKIDDSNNKLIIDHHDISIAFYDVNGFDIHWRYYDEILNEIAARLLEEGDCASNMIHFRFGKYHIEVDFACVV